MKKLFMGAGTFAAGVINGLLGAGGGMLVLPVLVKSGLSQKRAHATSILIIFVFCLMSSAMYIYAGRVSFSDVLPYIPTGILGALVGAWLLTKLSDVLLRKVFGAFMLWAAIRLLMS